MNTPCGGNATSRKALIFIAEHTAMAGSATCVLPDRAAQRCAIKVGPKSMFDAAIARRMMVDGQIRTADVTDLDLLAAMQDVPRERFVPPALAEQAYVDGDLALGNGRALVKPMVLAKLIQAVRVRSEDHVLDIGCGTGYSSAVLARLAGSVVALEEDEALARHAKENLAAMDERVVVATGPLIAGWPAAAPYDVIFLNGATEIVPEGLGKQLKPGGRLACIFRRAPTGKAMIYRPIEGQLVGRPAFDAVASLLPGFVAPPAFVF
jgi:protein-L-isoaspartate(D-aspartate) O-methyltransferase